MDLKKFGKKADQKEAPKAPSKEAPKAAENSLAAQQRAEREAANQDNSVRYVDMKLIDKEDQTRKEFDQEYIESLAADFASVSSKQPDNPITLWEKPDGRFMLATGENRLFAMEHNLNTLGDEYISIRATIYAEAMPENFFDREAVRLRENVKRKGYNDAELALSADLYKKEHPEASLADIAKWMQFPNIATGRNVISRCMKLLEADSDIFEQVRKGDLKLNAALNMIKAREKEAKLETQQEGYELEQELDGTAQDEEGQPKPPVKKPVTKKSDQIASGKKKVTYSITEDDANNVITIINHLGQQLDPESDQLLDPKKYTRKDFKVLLSEHLPELIEQL